MVEQWAYINIDSRGIADARAHANDVRQANANMQEAQRIIDRLYSEKLKAESDLAAEKAENHARLMLLQSLIDEGTVSKESLAPRMVKAKDIAFNELMKVGVERYLKTKPSKFRV